MENQSNTGMAIFRQICEVNELDPDKIIREVQQHSPDHEPGGAPEEELIRAALQRRATLLLESIHLADAEAPGALYKIDSDPAAPSFQVREDAIRNMYDASEAEQIIDILRQVKLPVQG